MSPQTPSPIPLSVLFALIFGGLVLVAATVLAVRRAAPRAALGWLVIAGLAQVILALAAGLVLPAGDGPRAAALQALAVCLAGALGVVCGSHTTTAAQGLARGAAQGPGRLAPAGAGIAYLLLLGLPPTTGFHAKVLMCLALLQVGWTGMVVLVLAASAASLPAALWAASSAPRSRLGWGRGTAAVALVATALATGLYPHWGLAAASRIARVVLGG